MPKADRRWVTQFLQQYPDVKVKVKVKVKVEDWTQEDPGFFLYYPSRRLVPAPLRAFIDVVQAQPARSGYAAR